MKHLIWFSLLYAALAFFSCSTERTPVDGGITGVALPARALRYHPEGGDFVIVNGDRKYNRALYGTHTAFRVEAGDLPEFAMYLRGMGGHFKLGLVSGDSSRWLSGAEQIKARYRPGSMRYEITDPLLGDGILHLEVLALAGREGMVIRTGAELISRISQ